MVCASLPGIQLTKEQNDILDTCLPPPEAGKKGQLVRVTAAAGTGKTTTLLCLALKAADQGHKGITYLTFTKAAALDGTRRVSQVLEQTGLAGRVTVDARTLHSCAARALNDYRRDQDPDVDFGDKIWSDKRLESEKYSWQVYRRVDDTKRRAQKI